MTNILGILSVLVVTETNFTRITTHEAHEIRYELGGTNYVTTNILNVSFVDVPMTNAPPPPPPIP